METQRGIALEETREQKEAAENKHIEREKKFLLDNLPDNLESFEHEEIEQGYITGPEDKTEVRLRRKGEGRDAKYFQTIKTGRGEERGEQEIEIFEEQFDSLWSATEGKRIGKTRYKIPYKSAEGEEYIIEVDVFGGKLEGHITAEVESTKEGMEKFVPPDWFGEEVTEDDKYKNKNLAYKGLPRPKKKIMSAGEKEKNPEAMEKYDLEIGVAKLIDSINEKIAQARPGEPVIVEIAGGSASGKTSAVAAKVQEAFGGDAFILSMDNYYRGGKYVKEHGLNFDQPEALDLELLNRDVQSLKQEKPIKERIYHFSDDPPEETGREIMPGKVIIIEGLFALNDQMQDLGDVKAFVDIGTHGRILRRILRDIKRTGQKPADILKYFSEVVEPMHEEHIDSTKKNADFIIENEYRPDVEAERSGMHEIQVKYKAVIDENRLRELGAERQSSSRQVDNYYNPKDRKLSETGEVLRIREENDERVLTYKGPKIAGAEYRERPKFEFKIDKDIEEKFLGIYGGKMKVIEKDRTLYKMDGIVFAVDSVSKVENNHILDLGNFIEIRTTDLEANAAKIEEVRKKLGLRKEDEIKEAYSEM